MDRLSAISGGLTQGCRFSPSMNPVPEAPAIDDSLSDLGNAAGSQVGSLKGSAVCSAVTGSQSQMGSVRTGANYSAFTAPPRYRNSGAFVHGTKFRHFHSIMEQGLKAAKSDIYMIDEVRTDGRVPGLRDPPEILILIDETKARGERMEFEYDAAQGSWKTKGINGVIRPWFFSKSCGPASLHQRECVVPIQTRSNDVSKFAEGSPSTKALGSCNILGECQLYLAEWHLTRKESDL